jgi:hypothetical protein
VNAAARRRSSRASQRRAETARPQDVPGTPAPPSHAGTTTRQLSAYTRILNPTLAELDPKLPDEIATRSPLARSWKRSRKHSNS